MPIYDYACTACRRRVELIHGINEAGPSTCDACGGRMTKLLSPPAIVFKGSGWAKKDRAKPAAGGTEADGKAAGDGKPGAEAKPAAEAAAGASAVGVGDGSGGSKSASAEPASAPRPKRGASSGATGRGTSDG